jgi:DNA gyrase subunit A
LENNINMLRVKPVNIEEEMKKSFISYAMATIISRALPDVRDGLKPVHRRILYAMHELGLTADKPHRKSVRIVGDVLGKYHPHGDVAVYDAMVRMAQDFSIRYMLVDGHGNFGSIDGDGAAAMRYTEARLAKIAHEMLRDIDKETVNFVPNFDETQMQPEVLPSRFPNLLVNGSSGIAVGMATNIPPHNLREVTAAVVALIDNPDITVEELMAHIPGPDFPTGALIMGRGGILEAYRTGRGRIVMRGKTHIEDMGGGRSRIVVTEIPYMVNKARLVEKIAELVQSRRLEGISDLREESDRTGMRIVIELKRDVNAGVVLNALYMHTQLQETFGVNMLALVNGEPRVMSLKQMLFHYLDHQKDVVTRRTKYELDRAQNRAHIIEGLLKALDFIDAVIALIRASKTVNEARDGLMERFELSEKQAQAILDMRLQRLTGLEQARLLEEYEGLRARIDYLTRVLADEGLLMGIIRQELLEITEKFGDDRRTQILDDPSDINMEALIQREAMVVTMTHAGYIKRLALDTYRSQRRGGRGVMGQGTREEDFVERILVTSTHDWLLFFTNTGRVHRLKCYQVPEAGRAARGMAVMNLLQLDPGEKVQTLLPLGEAFKTVQDMYLVLATRQGMIKRTPISELANLRNVGLKAIVLNDGDELIGACLTDGNQEIYMGSRSGMAIRFPENDIRPMHRVAMGVRGMRLRDGDAVVDMGLVDPSRELLAVSELGYGKRTPFDEYRVQSRGGYGIITMSITERTGPLVNLRAVSDEDDLMLISSDGTLIRMEARDISTFGRATQGVRLMRVRNGGTVVALAVIDQDEEEGDQDGDAEVTPAAAPVDIADDAGIFPREDTGENGDAAGEEEEDDTAGEEDDI